MRLRRTLVTVLTDFEVFGLDSGPLDAGSRSMVLTVDFEAFDAATVPLWASAMAHWVQRAAGAGLRFTYFVSVEDVVRVRDEDVRGYQVLVDGLRALEGAGGSLHPHNHRVFDRDSGRTMTPRGAAPHRIDGYPRRASVFYDVVYRHRRDWGAWMSELREVYEAVLADAGIAVPDRLAFRPGGWDHGVTRDDLEQYLEGLRGAGYRIDSSATSGVFGTPSWRVGAPAGSNLYGLSPDLVEIAPCASLDCGAAPLAQPTLSFLRSVARQGALWRPPLGGVAFVVVLHFDHLFHRAGHQFAVRDERRIRRRIDGWMRRLALLRELLRLESVLLDEVRLST
jgi:hypothetical protein